MCNCNLCQRKVFLAFSPTFPVYLLLIALDAKVHFPPGNSWECFLTFGFQLPGSWDELPDIMYFDFLKACDKVCHKTAAKAK